MISHEEVQSSLFKKYNFLLKKSTIREISHDSGIQQTRIFRLLNGSEMKLSEYLIIKNRVDYLSARNSDIAELTMDCEALLSSYGIQKLSQQVERKVRLARLIMNNNCAKKAA
ncbi:hypothetical protein [Halobacteriovorax sp. HLS]|uniref:hypothetical protein n=1 Tax=Halobacteriovorax sp. HLS TaxID=2234000 RepID=UPI000FDA079A|nr:hypothetical protein [Halobacteriovorax sp. HLS]